MGDTTIIPVYIEKDGKSVVGGSEIPVYPNGVAFLDRRKNKARRDSLPAEANYLFERFGRALYKHMREHKLTITYTPMLDHEEAMKVSEELRPILQALWKTYAVPDMDMDMP